MAKNLEVCFIIDKSGSMMDVTGDTIGGFNSVIEQKKSESDFDNIIVTTVLFNEEIELIHDRVDIKDVKMMTERDYIADGNTALYDAIGYGITRIDKLRKKTPKRNRPDYTMVIIVTDGLENSSRKYTSEDIVKMIDEKGKEGWEFVYMGANVDSMLEADRIGVGANYSFDATGLGVRNLWRHSICCCMRLDSFEEDETAQGEESIRQKNAKKRAQKRGESENC